MKSAAANPREQIRCAPNAFGADTNSYGVDTFLAVEAPMGFIIVSFYSAILWRLVCKSVKKLILTFFRSPKVFLMYYMKPNRVTSRSKTVKTQFDCIKKVSFLYFIVLKILVNYIKLLIQSYFNFSSSTLIELSI